MRVGVCGSSAKSKNEYHLLLLSEEEVAALVDAEAIVCLLIVLMCGGLEKASWLCRSVRFAVWSRWIEISIDVADGRKVRVTVASGPNSYILDRTYLLLCVGDGRR
jgi:hypothetical protein